MILSTIFFPVHFVGSTLGGVIVVALGVPHVTMRNPVLEVRDGAIRIEIFYRGTLSMKGIPIRPVLLM
jgi:hypothetical protein